MCIRDSYNSISKSTAKIEIDERAKQPQTNILSPSKFEIQKYSGFKQENKVLRATEMGQISTKKDLISNASEKPQNAVLTTFKADSSEKWTLKEIDNNIKSYEGKIKKYGKNFARCANLAFFKQYRKRFKLDNQAGTMPKVEAGERKKWYENNYPEIVQKLKKADSEKRKK